MSNADRIDIDIFKVVTRAIAESDNLATMTDNLVPTFGRRSGYQGLQSFCL